MLNALSSTPLISLHATVLDTETTGLDPATARIIQIGAVRIRKTKLDPNSVIDCLVKPDVPIPPATSEIHGLTDADVADASHFAEALNQIEIFSEGEVVIGHNISFDLQIFSEEFRRHALTWRRPRALCTALLSRAANPVLNDYSLDNVCNWLEVSIENRHSALGDAVGTAEVFSKLIPHLKKKGIRTLAEAEAICKGFTDKEASEIGGSGKQAWTPQDEERPSMTVAQIDAFPFCHRVKDVMSSPARSIEVTTKIETVAKILSEENLSSVLVSPDEQTSNWGIITERDVMRLVAGEGPVQCETAKDIMNAPLITIAEEDFVYKALATMSNSRVRHLGIVDRGGEVVGVVTSGNLMRQRAEDALILGGKIGAASTIEDLAAVWATLPFVASSMLREGISVRQIAAIIAEETCALTKRAYEMAEIQMRKLGQGRPPCAYAVLVLGSGGRGETLLVPDQDNAIIFERDDEDGTADKWFEQLATLASDTLNTVGLPFCEGGVMAKNAAWRHTRAGWQDSIRAWTLRAEGSDILHIDIFYDFRKVYGDDDFALELRNFALESAKQSPALLRRMSQQTADLEPVTGLFGGIITRQGRVDAKKGGLLAIVSCARCLALANSISEVGTKQRLEKFRQLGLANDEDIENAILAHRFLLTEVLRQQLDDIEAGIPLSNKIELKRLSKRRKSNLKWAFERVEIVKQLTKDVLT